MARKLLNPSSRLLAGIALLAMPTVAVAQDSEESGDGDIIVTAQRQEQKLQDVPVSVTAFGSEQLRASNIETVAALLAILCHSDGRHGQQGNSCQQP